MKITTNNKGNEGDIFETKFYDSIYELSKEQVLWIAKENPDIMNVVRGVNRKALATSYNDKEELFEMYFFGENDGAVGYCLKLKFNQETYFDYLISFCFFLAREFTFIKPIHIYNGYIHQLRTYFESAGIMTVTETDKKAIIKDYGSGGVMMHPHGIIYLRDIKEIDFYEQLFGYSTKGFEPKEDKKYVYLIFNERSGYFKIGRSKNPLKREKTLQAEEPEIALLKIWEAEPSFEKMLHTKYSSLRKRGEWFELTFKELYTLKDYEYVPDSR